jgi:hypothetical protein
LEVCYLPLQLRVFPLEVCNFPLQLRIFPLEVCYLPFQWSGLCLAFGSAAPSVPPTAETPPPFSKTENGGGRTLILKKI